jgi:hypothetical protein
MVESVIRSIPEQSMDNAVAAHIGETNVIRHAGAESYVFDTELPEAFRTEMHFARRHVYLLKNVLVNLRTGACCTGGKLLFQESYGSMRRCLLGNPFPFSSTKSIHMHELATCVHATGYYHFLLEEIPRLLWVVAQYPKAKILISENNSSAFTRQILDMLVSQKAIRGYEIVSSGNVLQCHEYVFTQAEAYSGFVHSADLSVLLKFLGGKTLQPQNSNRKIYISRRNASRSFDNEPEVEEMLKKQGYDIVYSERLTFAEQIALFQSASMVIANHGAGLANLVWCHPKTHVVELFSPIYFNDCFARLSKSMQLSYQPLWATVSKGWGVIDLAILEKTANA